MKNLPPLVPDPVIEAYKKDVDRTLIRENLKSTPQKLSEQFLAMQAFYNEAQRLRAERRRKP